MHAQNQFQLDKSILQENTTALLKDSSNIKLNERFFLSASVHCPTKSIRAPTDMHVVNRLNIQLGAKMGVEIYRYQGVVLLALTLVEIFIILGFHEMLMYL